MHSCGRETSVNDRTGSLETGEITELSEEQQMAVQEARRKNMMFKLAMFASDCWPFITDPPCDRSMRLDNSLQIVMTLS